MPSHRIPYLTYEIWMQFPFGASAEHTEIFKASEFLKADLISVLCFPLKHVWIMNC